MFQCGLHVPAAHCSTGLQSCLPTSAMSSIEQSLSTLSSHLLNIVGIRGRRGSLVLLDKWGRPIHQGGAGDGAVGRVSSTRLPDRGDTTVTDLCLCPAGDANAGVQFDIRTLQPTFELTIGVPGQSNAFPIARRLRLPEEIITRAQSFGR